VPNGKQYGDHVKQGFLKWNNLKQKKGKGTEIGKYLDTLKITALNARLQK